MTSEIETKMQIVERKLEVERYEPSLRPFMEWSTQWINSQLSLWINPPRSWTEEQERLESEIKRVLISQPRWMPTKTWDWLLKHTFSVVLRRCSFEDIYKFEGSFVPQSRPSWMPAKIWNMLISWMAPGLTYSS